MGIFGKKFYERTIETTDWLEKDGGFYFTIPKSVHKISHITRFKLFFVDEDGMLSTIDYNDCDYDTHTGDFTINSLVRAKILIQLTK